MGCLCHCHPNTDQQLGQPTQTWPMLQMCQRWHHGDIIDPATGGILMRVNIASPMSLPPYNYVNLAIDRVTDEIAAAKAATAAAAVEPGTAPRRLPSTTRCCTTT